MPSNPLLNSRQLLIFSIWFGHFAFDPALISFIFQLEHLLEPVRIAQRLQLEMRAEVCAKTLNCAPGQWAESVPGHVLVSQLLCLHDSRQLNGRGPRTPHPRRLFILAKSYLITKWYENTHTQHPHNHKTQKTLNISLSCSYTNTQCSS